MQTEGVAFGPKAVIFKYEQQIAALNLALLYVAWTQCNNGIFMIMGEN